jgi:tetratricopeptide (TPR) repeat protein
VVSTTSAGQFHHNELDTDDAPCIVMFGDLDNDTLETFQPELTHYFVSHYAPNTPLWLTEGLATYYETLRQQAGSAHLGLPNARRWSGLLSAGVVPFPDLLAARRKEFYGDPHRALRDPRQRSQARQQKLDLDEALTHDANAPDVLYHLARWHQQHDQLDEAERLLKRALDSRPTEPRYLTGLLRVYADRMARSNRRQQAETAAEAVLARLLPLARSAGALNTIARFHAQAGRDDASTYFAKRAVATDPRCQPCRLTLAQQLFAGQQYAAAVRELERAINLLPHDSVPRSVLA